MTHLRIVVLSVLGAFAGVTLVACGGSSETVAQSNKSVGANKNLLVKADGSPSGDGERCSTAGVAAFANASTAPGTSPGSADGTSFGVGSSVPPPPDTCNTCECTKEGIVCTTIACGTGPGSKCEVGKPVPPPDSCNSCSCAEGGVVQCTAIACGPDPGPESKCEVGKPVPPPDSCNSCSCAEGGVVQCTAMACP